MAKARAVSRKAKSAAPITPSDTEPQRQSAAHRLPPEVLIEIFKFAFPKAFGAIALPLAICKGGRKNGRETLTVGHQHALIDQTRDTRALLALCPFSRRLVLNAKPHKLTFATRKTWGSIKKSAKGQHKFYGPEAVFTQDYPGLVYFSGTTDIVLIENAFPQRLVTLLSSSPFHFLTDFGEGHVQLLHLQSSANRFSGSGQSMAWDKIIDACPNLKTLYISQKDFIRPRKLHKHFAIVASEKVFDHHDTSRIHLVCYLKGVNQVSWGLNQSGRTFPPLYLSSSFIRYKARAVSRVPVRCRVLEAYEFGIKEIVRLRKTDDWMDQFRGTPPS